ncbi:MAG: hypothetical protein ACR2IP_01955 [Solirubrobacteraceae bacterium]
MAIALTSGRSSIHRSHLVLINGSIMRRRSAPPVICWSRSAQT